MAVYRHRYQSLPPERNREGLRFLVFARYALREVLATRLFVLFLVASFAAPLVGATIVYLHFNPLGLQVLQTTVAELIPINSSFFLRFLIIQTTLGTILAALVGPGLVAPDLANNALSLYLARPITRRDYILGKMIVLVGLMSVLTWVPILLLYLEHSALTGWSWFAANLGIAAGIVVCSALWILVVSLLALAVSAWVRWRPLATLAVLGYFLGAAALGSLVNEILSIRWGSLVNVAALMRDLWREFFGLHPLHDAVPPGAAVIALALTCLVFLAMLLRRVRAHEVVR
jgi:ABC-2 type transport system permease protein